MEENIITTEQGMNSTPEAAGGQGERTFTQDEVNRIVSERLARERAKVEPAEDARERALIEREKAIAARESRYKCEDYLAEINVIDKGCAADLLAVLDTSDFDKFKAAMDVLGKYFITQTREVGAPPPANPSVRYRKSIDEELRAAFTAHTPAIPKTGKRNL